MEYVKMPELLSAEAAKVLAGNMDAVRDIMSSRDHNGGDHKDDKIRCPKKIKFILILTNCVVINVNAVAAEDKTPANC